MCRFGDSVKGVLGFSTAAFLRYGDYRDRGSVAEGRLARKRFVPNSRLRYGYGRELDMLDCPVRERPLGASGFRNRCAYLIHLASMT